uniref:Peroxisomal biogenesis factor 12 n=1 Tax=Nephromyces sp. MMRI TaxID=2496275 RepID=A0A3Q8UC75_9APIC|nr:peroxisomal biogenesis factor 12 [Nephromyces sp. MMRI]AZL94752.1 peroxisomal biogenesis factor 12 [Nephromyces sp. MMRI]
MNSPLNLSNIYLLEVKQPTFFELVAKDELLKDLRNAVEFLITKIEQRYSSSLHPIVSLKYWKIIYYLGLGCLESYYLYTHNSSVSEYFFDIKRLTHASFSFFHTQSFLLRHNHISSLFASLDKNLFYAWFLSKWRSFVKFLSCPIQSINSFLFKPQGPQFQKLSVIQICISVLWILFSESLQQRFDSVLLSCEIFLNRLATRFENSQISNCQAVQKWTLQKLKNFIRRLRCIHPLIRISTEIFSLLYKVLYLINSKKHPYWSPFLHLIGVVYQSTNNISYKGENQQDQNVNGAANLISDFAFASQNASTANLNNLSLISQLLTRFYLFLKSFQNVLKHNALILKKSLTSSSLLKNLLIIFIFAYKCLEWWYQIYSSSTDSIQPIFDNYVPEPPPPHQFQQSPEFKHIAWKSFKIPQDPRICALCGNFHNMPACTPSGYVYCYICISKFVKKYGYCPCTGVITKDTQIRRIFAHTV